MAGKRKGEDKEGDGGGRDASFAECDCRQVPSAPAQEDPSQKTCLHMHLQEAFLQAAGNAHQHVHLSRSAVGAIGSHANHDLAVAKSTELYLLNKA